MPIIRDAELEFQLRAPGIKAKQWISHEMGAGAITLSEIIMEPGTSLPLHTHKVEEALFIIEGIAIAILGGETCTLEAKSMILAPAGVRHLLANRTQKPMRFLAFYPAVQVQRDVVVDQPTQ